MNLEPIVHLTLAAATEAAAASSATNTAGVGNYVVSREKLIGLGIEYGPKVLVATILLAGGMFAARWVGNIAMRGLLKRDMEPPLRMLLVRFVKLIVVLLSVLMAVQQLGVQLLPLIAGLGVAGVGVGLAMQGVLSNLVAGLTIIFVKKFRVGEYIELNGVKGEVNTIELFSTTLVHADRSRVIIPNRKIVGEIIHNYGKIRQRQISVSVAYGTDLNQAYQIIRDVLARNPRVLKDPEPIIGVAALLDSAVEIAIRPWTALPDYGPVSGEIHDALLQRFQAAGIVIPFPQREIRLLSASEVKNVA